MHPVDEEEVIAWFSAHPCPQSRSQAKVDRCFGVRRFVQNACVRWQGRDSPAAKERKRSRSSPRTASTSCSGSETMSSVWPRRRRVHPDPRHQIPSSRPQYARRGAGGRSQTTFVYPPTTDKLPVNTVPAACQLCLNHMSTITNICWLPSRQRKSITESKVA